MPNRQPPQYNMGHEQRVPDGVLVGQALAGDQAAFESLVTRYHHHLMSFTWGMLKDQDQCCDVLQQVYLQLYLSLPTLSRNVTLKSWLWQVARGNAAVVNFRIQGEGHRWPSVRFNIRFNASGGTAGSTGQALSASALIWSFFQQHPLVNK